MQHPKHSEIIAALKALEGKTNPWLIAIHESLPDENIHVTLVEQLASQAADCPKVMCGIVGVEVTELLLNRELKIV